MLQAAEALEVLTSLAWAHPVTAEWFLRRFGSPTEPQEQGWPSILAGDATLISAPTGSGKTLAAFLVCIDKLLRDAIAGTLAPTTQVVYVSPLKALSNDVQKNLEQPLREIQQLAFERGYLSTEIRTAVRTGDTLSKERAAMLRNPPHILVTTPESLYIMLTAGKSREHLRRVRTVIVDEIHAVADDKRGAHLALSLERLDALVRGENRLSPGAWLTGLATPPQRIGLSATQNPIELVADFLTGVHPERKPATIVQVGQRRQLDLAIEVPSDELTSVLTTKMWEEIFDKLAAYTQTHRSTLVFVNTRRLVERVAFALAERLGPENVAAHHGSLSRALRLDAEQRLKSGEIKILVATASLELGIDIGDVDLVCQISTTRSVAIAMQRVGRAGHWRGAVPKGRLFATTRDDLLEQAALIRKMRSGELDKLEVPPEPIDVLMQQIVAACGAEPWEEDALFAMLTRALPYRNLTRARFDEIISLLANGIESSRGRYGAYLLRDGIHGQLHPRRGARMIAISNGGAIPETNVFPVILQPEGVQIATLDEHFAVDSSPGDVVLLGSASWRIQRIEAAGRVLVEDAHGAPPSLPFWFGEAPQRTEVLCDGVGELRATISEMTRNVVPGYISAADPEVDTAIAWLMENCGVCASGAIQLISYIVTGRAVLGAVPSKTTIIAERFFDEGGGMQLILHAPFGGRINKAWGLALRKRFCRGFNFELQAAATDNGINISLAEQHSFPLSDVFQFLTEHTAKDLLEQASLASPIFKTRWRWAANRSLQLLRNSKGKRIPPQIQRTRSEDLLASVFPQAAACFENIEGDIQIPTHPLVDEVMKDVLQEAMDLEGLIEVLRCIKDGSIRCLAVDTPVPSQFSHELLNANPYAFLDEAGLEERRARAVSLSRTLPTSVLEEAGRLDQNAIDEIRRECWPDIRDEHEMHDLLHSLIALPVAFFAENPEARHWPAFYDRLLSNGRAQTIDCGTVRFWTSAERAAHLAALREKETDTVTKEQALRQCVQGWMQILGPTTASAFAELLDLSTSDVFQAFLAMEMQGLLMRGVFERSKPADDHEIEWCERRILQRIHRRTLHTLRRQIEPVAPSVYMRWLLQWQHLAPQMQLTGEEGVLEALHQLEGFEAPAIEWERTLLPARVANYDPRWLDSLCLSGAVGWGRISPHPAWSNADGVGPRRVVPTNAAPITFYIRESADWLPHALARERIEEARLEQSLSPEALQVRAVLQQRGACFASDIQRIIGLSRQQAQHALWELATAGIAAADGYDQLRAIMDPRRKSAAITGAPGKRPVRSTAGRWSLLTEEIHAAPTAIEQARRTEAALESYARMLLARYGVLFRDLLVRESNAPKWRDLLGILRRLEARGEIRGGRFVTGFGGEQYALPEAADSLRAARSRESTAIISVAAADPANLAGIVLPGERIPAIPGRQVVYRNGVLHGNEATPTADLPVELAAVQTAVQSTPSSVALF
ncbi:DEAD/DEAH box helicase [Edaphobacter aggregans]|uniref:DEAD/DEAH box helicase n=1 Tax=Edaphobacter aggregans TaxID=570835 RepID=UPI0006905ACE|nr:DEAD/DEAH box helicase [Edaphobacter aggregans]